MSDMLQVVEELVATDGNVALVAERLGDDVTPGDVLRVAIENDEKLANAARAAITLNLIETLAELKNAMLNSLADLPASQIATTYVKVVEAASVLMKQGAEGVGHTTNNQFNFGDGDVRRTVESRLARLIDGAGTSEDS